MAVGNIPGDLVASAVLDTVALTVEPGSIGVSVSSVVADGPSALRVTLSGPADIGGTIAIAEVDSNGGAPFVAVCEPTGAPNEWRLSWAAVPAAGVASVSGSSPVSVTTTGSAAVVGLNAGSTAGDVLTWSGSAWSGAPPSGVGSVTGTAPIGVATVGGAATVALAAGSTAGDVLTWSGSAWSGATPAAPAAPIHLSIDTRTPTTTAYELRGAVYLDSPFTFAAGCLAYWYQGGSSNTSYMQLSNASGTKVAEWISTTNFGAARFISAAIAAPFVGTTVPAGWYHIDVKFTSGGASTTNGLGLFLTE